MLVQDRWADDRLEAPLAAIRRFQLRAEARRIWAAHRDCRALAARLDLPHADVLAMMRSPWFGAAWAEIEAASPVLKRWPIEMAALRTGITEAEALLAGLMRMGADGRGTAEVA
jgi:hypothetical protein